MGKRPKPRRTPRRAPASPARRSSDRDSRVLTPDNTAEPKGSQKLRVWRQREGGAGPERALWEEREARERVTGAVSRGEARGGGIEGGGGGVGGLGRGAGERERRPDRVERGGGGAGERPRRERVCGGRAEGASVQPRAHDSSSSRSSTSSSQSSRASARASYFRPPPWKGKGTGVEAGGAGRGEGDGEEGGEEGGDGGGCGKRGAATGSGRHEMSWGGGGSSCAIWVRRWERAR